MRRFARRRAIEQEFIDERLPPHPAMNQEVFQAHEPLQVHPQLRIGEPRVLAHFAAAKAVFGARELLGRARGRHHLDNAREHPPRLRRQLIEAAAQDFVGQGIRLRDVLPRRLDVFEGRTLLLYGPTVSLVLMQQRDRVDQGQVFLVVAPRAGFVREERELIGVWI